MDSDTPSEEISLRTVLDAVNRQKQDIEVLVDTKISVKINSLRDEIHGTNQCMKSQVKKLKSDSQYKWRSEVNKIQFNDVNTSASWYSYIKLSESSIEQLQFWKLYISEVNIKHFSVDESCHSIIYSEASDTGSGGYIVETPQNITHEALWGPHEVDWFASDHNFKLLVVYSRFWNGNSSGIDAFTVNWFGVNGLFVPPVFLIPRVINYMRQCNAVGTLIVPCWPSASYWPVLCPNGGDFTDQFITHVELPSGKEFYTPSKSKKAIFGNTDLTFNMLALRLDFRE
ncbi:unnamed protein product [Mytilus coruscus]|uniref:Uncharacterized protein n=1 Tax=Mytilus coruscus TaxID=42192 RepID=A0A6J8DLC8_MYTCO|nr:unnamed protein product [Mytilus coruscus]